MEKSYQKFFEKVGTEIEGIQKDMNILSMSKIEQKIQRI